MIIRIDLPIEKNIHSPALSYFIRDDCLYAYESCKFFTHSLAEICYIIHGKGHLKVNDYVFELNSGDLYILNPYVKHCEFLQKDRQEGFSYYILGIVNFKLQPDNATVFRPLPLPEKSNIVFLLDKIFAELKSQLPAHDEAAKKYFELLLIEIERLYSSRIEPAPFIQSDLTAQIQSYIDVNYAGELSSKSIAEHFGRKLNTIEIKFKKAFGLSIQSYILLKRIEGAMRMLESNRNIAVSELAAKAGFYNPTYFSRYFKKITGLSPSEYRKMLLEKNA